MELWNPRTHKVDLLWDEIPPEENKNSGLKYAELITVNSGAKFIVYGGYNGNSATDGIWKYSVSENLWTRYM